MRTSQKIWILRNTTKAEPGRPVVVVLPLAADDTALKYRILSATIYPKNHR